MLTKRRWTATTVALTMALGCGNAGDETAEEDTDADTVAAANEVVAETPAAGEASSLEGTVWRLVSYGPDEPVPDEIEITAGFAGGRIAGNSACNRYTGAVEIDTAGGTLKAGALVSTKMACPPPQMENESRYLGVLEDVTRFELAGDRLTLYADEGSSVVFERTGGRA